MSSKDEKDGESESKMSADNNNNISTSSENSIDKLNNQDAVRAVNNKKKERVYTSTDSLNTHFDMGLKLDKAKEDKCLISRFSDESSTSLRTRYFRNKEQKKNDLLDSSYLENLSLTDSIKQLKNKKLINRNSETTNNFGISNEKQINGFSKICLDLKNISVENSKKNNDLNIEKKINGLNKNCSDSKKELKISSKRQKNVFSGSNFEHSDNSNISSETKINGNKKVSLDLKNNFDPRKDIKQIENSTIDQQKSISNDKIVKKESIESFNENKEILLKYKKVTEIILPRETDKYGFILPNGKPTSPIDNKETIRRIEKIGIKWHNLISEIKLHNLKENEERMTESEECKYRYLICDKKARNLVFKLVPLFMKYKLWKSFVYERKILIKSQRSKNKKLSNKQKNLINDLESTKLNNSIYKNLMFAKSDDNINYKKEKNLTEKNKKSLVTGIKNIFTSPKKSQEKKSSIKKKHKDVDKLCNYEHQIHVDVQRTFRRHSLFFDEYGPGQIRLFNVLVLFANIHPEIGYCQGMSSFVAIILMYFPQNEALQLLLDIFHINSNLFTVFDKELSGICPVIHCQAQMMKRFLPKLYDHLISNNIDLGSFVFSWYLTLFSRFDMPLVLRIWDLFLFFDFSIFVLAAVALMKCVNDVVLDLDGEEILHYLGNMENYPFDPKMVVEYIEEFMNNTDMEKLRKDLKIGW